MDDFSFPDLPPAPAMPIRRDRPAPRALEPDPSSGLFPNELGTPVAIPGLCLVLDDLAVALDTFFVHQRGVHALLRVTFRDPLTESRASEEYTFHRTQASRPGSNQRLWRLAVQFADGQAAYTPSLPDPPPWNDDFVLSIQGGGGDSQRAIHRVYLSPVPPRGPMRILLDLADRGVHHMSSDATQLADAAQSSGPLWV